MLDKCECCGQFFSGCHRHQRFCSRQCANNSIRTTTPVSERFWDKVEKTRACWLWTASCLVSGYGRIKIKGKWVRAHRVAWELVRGTIPDGLWVLHHCDNPSCVRPDHLFLGTAKDNSQDCWKKKRALFQRRNPTPRKLRVGQVHRIRLLIQQGHPHVKIAARFGVSSGTISNIRTEKTYRWVK